jgi:hypothetical protein
MIVKRTTSRTTSSEQLRPPDSHIPYALHGYTRGATCLCRRRCSPSAFFFWRADSFFTFRATHQSINQRIMKNPISIFVALLAFVLSLSVADKSLRADAKITQNNDTDVGATCADLNTMCTIWVLGFCCSGYCSCPSGSTTGCKCAEK